MGLPLTGLEQEATGQGSADGVDRGVCVEGGPEHGTALGGRELKGTVVLQQFRAEVMRLERGVLRAETGSALGGARVGGAGLRHDGEVAVVADPGAGLVRRPDALQLAVPRMEEPAATLLVRLR